MTSFSSNLYYANPKITVFAGLLIMHINSSLLKTDKKNNWIRLFFQKENNIKSHPHVKHLIFRILVLQGNKVLKFYFSANAGIHSTMYWSNNYWLFNWIDLVTKFWCTFNGVNFVRVLFIYFIQSNSSFLPLSFIGFSYNLIICEAKE